MTKLLLHLLVTKEAHVFLILVDPVLDLLCGEYPRLGDSRALGTKTFHQKEQEFALLGLG
jgi:hypothetical protein